MGRFSIPEGASVKYRHVRKEEDGFPFNVSPRGGRTLCLVTLEDGTEYEGVARCRSNENYSKKLGRNIALGRALAQLPREEEAHEGTSVASNAP